MAIAQVKIDGVEYPMAPLEPELWDRPSPAYPMAITPEIAQHWLTFNYRNRNKRDKGLRDYSADMQEGSFAVNGSTVTFSRPLTEGEDEDIPAGRPCLMDGQHRLVSCVRAGASFVAYVAYGISPKVRQTIDVGMKRTLGDSLQMQGEKHANVLASVLVRVNAWMNGDHHLTLKRVTATHAQMWELLGEHPEVRRSVEVATQTRHDFFITTGNEVRQSNLGLAHWLLMQADETRAPEFFARLGDGSGLLTEHPIMALRRRLVRDATVRKQVAGASRREIPVVRDWEQVCYYIRTWNALMRWEATPEHRRPDLKEFLVIGRSDKDRMPRIKTFKEVEAELARAAEEAEAA